MGNLGNYAATTPRDSWLFLKNLLGWCVVKAQVLTVFSVTLTDYGWSVTEGSRHLGLFVSQRQALDDVKKRRAELKAKGRASSVVVTGEEPPRGGNPRPFRSGR
jgi:hypothetical protein